MKSRAFAVALTLTCLGSSARADVILDPVSVSTNMGTLLGSINHTTDQSGLSSTYTSGVTNFASYTATATENSSSTSNIWNSYNATGNIDLSLGGSYSIDSIALWSLGANRDNIEGFTLLGANNSSFTGATTLGSFTLSNSTPGGETTPAQDFSFAATTASYVRIEVTSSYYGLAALGEVALSEATATAVPEPSSLAIASVGGLGMGYWLLRRRRRVA